MMSQGAHFFLTTVPNSSGFSVWAQILIVPIAFVALSIARHIINQLVFLNKDEPPLVFSWLPLIGSTIEYGQDPYKFYFKYQKKYGNIFSFVLVGRKHTVCFGTEGNNFVLNGAVSEISAADIYRDLTLPIFGKDVCYDCSPGKLMEQKKLIKYSLTPDKLDSFVPIFLDVMQNYVDNAKDFRGNEGTFDVIQSMAVTTIFTAAASLQGKEVREKLDHGLADLYHTLDLSFIPINFYLPGLPLPVNRRRDKAQKEIVAIYTNIIKSRRALGSEEARDGNDDMIWSLMRSTYKDGTPVPDHEIANLMIAILMAGQHNSYSVGAWILFRLASRPEIQEELYQEQLQALDDDLNVSKRDLVSKLPLHKMVVRETLRLHDPIHTVMRAVKTPLEFVSCDPETSSCRKYKIPTSHVLISAPGVTAQSAEFFPEPEKWDPKRWETMTEFLGETEKRGAMSAFLPFGAGRHRCVGEAFAYLQLSTITAFMVRNFVFGLLDGEGVPKTDYTAMITRPVTPARLRWERRTEA